MRRLGLLVIAAACDGNVYIEVRTTNVTADHVELFISNDPCVLIDTDGSKTSCTGMQPQGFSGPIGSEGAVFFRDALDENLVAVDSSGSAFFELLAGPETLHLVVAVGTSGADGAKTITGVAIMEGTIDLTKSPIRYLAELEPVEPLTEAGPVGHPRVRSRGPTPRRRSDASGSSPTRPDAGRCSSSIPTMRTVMASRSPSATSSRTWASASTRKRTAWCSPRRSAGPVERPASSAIRWNTAKR
jgi:hypothetical protein